MNSNDKKALEVKETLLANKVAKMHQRRKLPFRRIFNLWSGCSFATFLGAIYTVGVLLQLRIDNNSSLSGLLMGYVLFLPMAFYFSAQTSYTDIAALEKRIDELESQLNRAPKA